MFVRPDAVVMEHDRLTATANKPASTASREPRLGFSRSGRKQEFRPLLLVPLDRYTLGAMRVFINAGEYGDRSAIPARAGLSQN